MNSTLKIPDFLLKIRFDSTIYSLNNWGIIRVSGKDCIQFLQGQLTNDIHLLTNNSYPSQLNTRLNLKGHITNYFYLIRKDTVFFIIIPKNWQQQLIDDLDKYIITEEIELKIVAETNLTVILGYDFYLIQNRFDNAKSALINFYEQESLLVWGEENNKIVESLNYLPLTEFNLNILKVFSGLNSEFDYHKFINETRLNEYAISYKKGCFLGQEVVSKIESRRGAAYYPILATLNNQISLEKLVHKEIFINEQKVGIIINGTHNYLVIHLLRDYRINNLNLNVKIFSGEELNLTLHYYPLISSISKKEKLDSLYAYALELYTHQDDFSNSEIYLKKIIEIDQNYADAYEALGVILAKQKRFEEAISVMLKLKEVDPNSLMCHTNLSLYYMNIGKIKEAEEEKANATLKSFNHYGQLAKQKKEEQEKIEKQNKEMDQREKLFMEVLSIDPDDPLANYGLGDIAFIKKEYNSAQKYFEKVINFDKKYSLAYLGLGKTLEELKEFSRAKEIYTTGIKIAASKGELMPANQMQARLVQISDRC